MESPSVKPTSSPSSFFSRPLPAAKKPKGIPKSALFVFGASLVIALVVIAVLWTQLREARQQAVQVPAPDETAQLVAEVGKLIRLPEDEAPTVATVSDPEKLREQAFFKNASEGDKVLIYTQSKKAILYSPALKQVIEVANVNLSSPPAATAPATAP
ncbi:hypothetical protein EPO34_04900 [Patescibacteria group bacterium]|nr:MAG: hypothetical protein EPO34_04900 [Patescibacteria group bacterium]